MSEEKQEKPAYGVIEYPRDAYFFNPVPVPASATFRFVPNAPQNVTLHPKGGIMVQFPDGIYPYKGLKSTNKIFAFDAVKKHIKGPLSVIANTPLKYLIPLTIFLPPSFIKKIAIVWAEEMGDFCNALCKNYWINSDKYYSLPVQEIRRAFLKTFNAEADPTKDQQKEIERLYNVPLWRIGQTLAFILEPDRSYLWRFQDVFQLINTRDMKNHPAKEIRRLLNILAERDTARNWKPLATAIYLFILFRPDIKRVIQSFCLELDTQKLWFDESDLYWCLPNGDDNSEYKYLGADKEDRSKIRRNIIMERLKELNKEELPKPSAENLTAKKE